MIRINLLRGPGSQPVAKVAPVKDEPEKTHKEAKPLKDVKPIKEVKPMSESAGKPAPVVGVLMFFVFASFGGVYYWWLNNNYQAEEQRNEVLTAEKKELEPYFKLEEQFRAQKESLEKKETALTKLKKQQQMPVSFLNELFDSLPESVGLVKVVSKGQKVEIRGESPTEDAVYQFESNLKSRSHRFANVVFGSSTRKTGTTAGYDFGITFDLTNP
ncbi:MAG: PilN domain-containing protein [Holophagaceae bacterium]|nr:PilN domain-containing protein [Holophagaceae bacterium]